MWPQQNCLFSLTRRISMLLSTISNGVLQVSWAVNANIYLIKSSRILLLCHLNYNKKLQLYVKKKKKIC